MKKQMHNYKPYLSRQHHFICDTQNRPKMENDKQSKEIWTQHVNIYIWLKYSKSIFFLFRISSFARLSVAHLNDGSLFFSSSKFFEFNVEQRLHFYISQSPSKSALCKCEMHRSFSFVKKKMHGKEELVIYSSFHCTFFL